MSRDLDTKLADFDRHADLAVTVLIHWLEEHREYLIAGARGRLIWGHYRFRDTLMYEYGVDELRANAAEELFDAINYEARRLGLAPSCEESPSAA